MRREIGPAGCPLTALGIFRVPRVGGRFDNHFHDCDEYWLIYKGRAVIATEGNTYEVGPGDVVYTRAGEEHDVIEVSEDLEAFFLEDRLVGEGRVGHLHRTPDLSAGHDVADGGTP
ncbi:cupin domain-containing protein [Rhodococcus sp. NPDC059968]|uniref:cupin domain-containing protein n=1 Tax=Rhodococcus sp. NPDC059968 TaxID=3347017 RepID=UPI00366FDF1A